MERRTTEAALIPALQLLSYLIIALGALFMAFKAGSLPASRWEPMSAGTFPQIIFSSITILCGMAIIFEFFKHGLPRTSFYIACKKLIALKAVIINLVLFTVYMTAMPIAGFITSTFIYLLTTQLYLAPRTSTNIVIATFVAILFSAGPYYLFSEAFNIYLPRAQW
ncbi:tripartite tricarboxylate transporter TctB family protein [Vreelandella andesensis]|uniref:Tripartite tricarboxylate transporter TctB family protein n=1 Tax=Vreelandella andesensis TaxID=447567 RepID=A0A433KP85_9GAMM|nr:tripartite tricarboxylate transporter TctB family protein [Halomonas andesensis]RUR31450.1 tripartite tricarboxylate transporter TctB family protein [Halomonas andesensis]